MNNHDNDIDDILDILNKNKNNLKSSSSSDDCPTRLDTDAIKKPSQHLNASSGANSNKSVHGESKNTVEEVFSNSEKKVQNKPLPQKNQEKASASSNNLPETSISLDDFDNMQKNARQKSKKTDKNKNFYVPGYVKLLIYLIAVFSVSIFISVCTINIGNDIFAFVKAEKEAVVSVKEGATLDDIADLLYENDIIKYPTVYKMYTKFRMDKRSYLTGNFVAGEHTVKSTMNYDQLLSSLAESTYTNSIVRVTIPEGYTVYELIKLLEEKRVINSESKPKLIAKLNNTSSLDYKFLPEMPKTITDSEGNTKLDTKKLYLLEGYLFPDTYDFYIGENIDSIISKFLNNFSRKFDESFYSRCQELGMTVDEVVTLASMIQAEGNNSADFYKISSVFHNRLKNRSNYPRFESDATSVYAFQGSKDRNKLSADDIKFCDSPYNTYSNNGLPPGAICNPGHDAIYAALYPAEYITELDERGNSKQIPIKYYFFYTASCNGKTYFAKNIDQHNAFIEADRQQNSAKLDQLQAKFN